jgi:short-subunit dehydrogenase
VTTLNPVTLVVGASGGIGAALVREFARHGHRLVLAARREEALAAVADGIAATGQPRPDIVAIDLTASGAIDRLAQELERRGVEPQNLVNSAGFGLLGLAHNLSRAEQLAMIELNVRVLTDLSLRFVESIRRHRGGILNVGSMTGFYPGPAMAVYHATKAYALSFGEALHVELKDTGVRVTTLCPGPVETDFMTRAGVRPGDYPQSLVLSAERVARDGYRGFMQGRRLVVSGFLNRLALLLPRLLPRTLLARLLGLSQQDRRRALRRG